jgi:hypothetical protein
MGHWLDGINHGLNGGTGHSETMEANESDGMDNSVKAAFKVGGGNGSSFVFLSQQIVQQDRAQNLFNGSMFSSSAPQFRVLKSLRIDDKFCQNQL